MLVVMKSLTDAVVDAPTLAAATQLVAVTHVAALDAEARVALQLRFQLQLPDRYSQLQLQHQKQCQLQLQQLTHRPSSLHDCTTISQRRAALLVCLEWHDNHVDLRWERIASCSVTSSL